jgi:hypothetical protein
MAQVLEAQSIKTGHRFWAVDRLCLAYLAAIAVILAAYWTRIPQAPMLLTIHAAFALLIVLASRREGRISWWFRNWYPLPLVSFCYREMAILIPAIRGRDYDGVLASLDFSIWHANPTVWLERVQTSWLTLFLQAIYTLFVPAVLLVPCLLWRQRRFLEFRYMAFLIALGYLVSYIGYILVPARGPRFFLDSLQHQPLTDGAAVNAMRALLDWIESAHYDCFPSGHTELTILAWWSSRLISPGLHRAYLAYTMGIIFATVYLRYHYTVDLCAGVVVAAALLATAPAMYRWLSGGEGSIGT